jgi:hypothetical protein
MVRTPKSRFAAGDEDYHYRSCLNQKHDERTGLRSSINPQLSVGSQDRPLSAEIFRIMRSLDDMGNEARVGCWFQIEIALACQNCRMTGL